MGVETECYLSNLVMHKISHHMGPVFIVTDKVNQPKGEKKKKELKLISEYLSYIYPVVEEMKARLIGLHNTSVLIEEGLIPREKEINIYATYLVSLVDRIRKNLGTRLNVANIAQFNYLLNKGGIVFNINNRKLSIHRPNFVTTVKDLTSKAMGNYSNLFSIMNKNGQPGPVLEELLNNINDIPVKTGFQFNHQIDIVRKEK